MLLCGLGEVNSTNKTHGSIAQQIGVQKTARYQGSGSGEVEQAVENDRCGMAGRKVGSIEVQLFGR
jgi:hypothetical protein